MSCLLRPVTRMMGGAFHAFSEGLWMNQKSDPGAWLRGSSHAAVKKQAAARDREKPAERLQWSAHSPSDLPTIGVL